MIIKDKQNLDKSKNQEITHTIKIDKQKKVNKIIELSTTNGEVKYEMNNNNIKLLFSNGEGIKEQVSGKLIPEEKKYISEYHSKDYNENGFTGTLEKYLHSGSYTPSDTKYVTGQSSSYYNSEGYKGTLEKYVASGSYTPSHTKHVTGQSSSYYNSGGYSGTLTKYVYSGSYTPKDTKEITGHSSPNYNSGGYSGTLTKYLYDTTINNKKSTIKNSNERPTDTRYSSGGFYNSLHLGSVYMSEYSNKLSFGVYLSETGDTRKRENLCHIDIPLTDSEVKLLKDTNNELVIDIDLSFRDINYKSYNYYDDFRYTDYSLSSVSNKGVSSSSNKSFSSISFYGGKTTDYYVTDINCRYNVYVNSKVETEIYKYKGTVTRPESDTRVYKYKGDVTKPSSDTRVYKYRGDVTRPEVDTRVYKYKGEVIRPEEDTRVYEVFYYYDYSIIYDISNILSIQLENGDNSLLIPETSINSIEDLRIKEGNLEFLYNGKWIKTKRK